MKGREAIKTALKGLAFVGGCAVGVKPAESKPKPSETVTVLIQQPDPSHMLKAIRREMRNNGHAFDDLTRGLDEFRAKAERSGVRIND